MTTQAFKLAPTTQMGSTSILASSAQQDSLDALEKGYVTRKEEKSSNTRKAMLEKEMKEANDALEKAHKDSLMAKAGEKVALELEANETAESKKDKDAAIEVAKATEELKLAKQKLSNDTAAAQKEE